MKIRFLYIIFLSSFLGGFAQESPKKIKVDTTQIEKRNFNEEQLKAYKSLKDFQYEIEDLGPSLYEQITAWFKRILRKFFSWFFDDVDTPVGFMLSFFTVLPYIIAVIVLYLIINFFLNINARNLMNGQSNREIVHLEDEEELLQSKDLPRLIALAIKEKNYRLATRYQYLLLLQKLSKNELIVWEQQKTNEDYIKEVSAKNIHTEFEEITRFYDFVWYGNFEINAVVYEKGIATIQSLTQKLT